MQTSPLFTGGLSTFNHRPTSNSTQDEIKTGDRVKHPKFGTGTVVAVAGDILTIAFPNGGLKKISAAFVKLEKA